MHRKQFFGPKLKQLLHEHSLHLHHASLFELLPHHHFPQRSLDHYPNLLISGASNSHALVLNASPVISVPVRFTQSFRVSKIVPNTVRLEFYKFRLTSSRSCSFSSSSLLDSTATRFRLRWESLPSFEGLPILICSDKKARKLRRNEPRCSMGLKTWLGYQFCCGSQSLGLNREARSLGLAWLPSLLSFPDHNIYT